jgi:hypothetical protein
LPGCAGGSGKRSFTFSLGATPARFDLVSPDEVLFCRVQSFGFGYLDGHLSVRSKDGLSGSNRPGAYHGPRESRQLVSGTAEARIQPYERWGVWRPGILVLCNGARSRRRWLAALAGARLVACSSRRGRWQRAVSVIFLYNSRLGPVSVDAWMDGRGMFAFPGDAR